MWSVCGLSRIPIGGARTIDIAGGRRLPYGPWLWIALERRSRGARSDLKPHVGHRQAGPASTCRANGGGSTNPTVGVSRHRLSALRTDGMLLGIHDHYDSSCAHSIARSELSSSGRRRWNEERQPLRREGGEMTRHVVTCVAVSALVLLSVRDASAESAFGGRRVRISAFGGYGANQQDDINMMTTYHENDFSDAEDFAEDWSAVREELNGAVPLGVSVEYLINERWGVGWEFMRLRGSGGFEGFRSDEIQDGWVDYTFTADYTPSANVFSVFGSYRIPLGSPTAVLRLGGGIGYLFGADLGLEWDGFHEFYDRRDRFSARGETSRWTAGLQTSGAGVAFHGLAGIEYRVTERVFVTGDLTYRFASVGKLEISDLSGLFAYEDFSDFSVGETLKWATDGPDSWLSTEVGEDIGLDFSGFYFTLGAALAF
jgi:hypothetical protein